MSEAGGGDSGLQSKPLRVCLLIHCSGWFSVAWGLERLSCWEAGLPMPQPCQLWTATGGILCIVLWHHNTSCLGPIISTKLEVT